MKLAKPITVNGLTVEQEADLSERVATYARACGVPVSKAAYVRHLIEKDLRTMRKIRGLKERK